MYFYKLIMFIDVACIFHLLTLYCLSVDNCSALSRSDICSIVGFV